MRRALTLAAALAAAAPALAQEAPENRVAVLTELSHLDNGQADWRMHSLLLSRHWNARTLVMAEAHTTERFGLTDREYALGGSVPAGERATLSLRATHSPTHRVLARGSAGGMLQYEVAKAWLVHGGYKHTRYDATDVDQGTFMLEHYFGNYSALAAVHRTRAFGEHTESFELRGHWYYTDKSSIGLYLAAGDEIAQLGAGALGLTRVRSVALVGRHAFAGSRWTAHYGLHRIRQGDAYTRSGFSAGVQYAF